MCHTCQAPQSFLPSQTLPWGTHILPSPPQSNSVRSSQPTVGSPEKKRQADDCRVVLEGLMQWVKKISVRSAGSICFLKTINYVQVQKYLFGINGLNLLQCISSEPSEQSMDPEHWRWPEMHSPLAHLNWSLLKLKYRSCFNCCLKSLLHCDFHQGFKHFVEKEISFLESYLLRKIFSWKEK